jgi:3-dehydroquinate synthase
MQGSMLQALFASFAKQTHDWIQVPKKPLARHGRCDVYCGARETVGGSSVSSGCWGEDSNHEYGWARRTPTYVAPIRFCVLPNNIPLNQNRRLHGRIRKIPILRGRRPFPSPMHRLEISLRAHAQRSDIEIGKSLRRDLGQLLSRSQHLVPRRALIVSNKPVFRLYGRQIVSSLRRPDLKIFQWLMPEGERFKSFRVLEAVVKFLGEKRFERNDIVIALGGGVVGDLAGFSAAIYLRGIPLVQVPTTLLAQIDSSVGGKTAINLAVGKNMVGAFYQPSLVVIDPETLVSLPERELVAGSCEMVKQSLVAGKSLFSATLNFLERAKGDRRFLLTPDFETLIASHCRFKASIVANDERESTSRSDAKSRRVLNFGHTTAHALEAITNYRVFRHGEAVGYGVLVAGEISRNLGLLTPVELESLRQAVRLCGPLPRADYLDLNQIIRALQHDKKSVAGQINWVLLAGIGLPRIVEGQQISAKLLRLSLRAGLQAFGRQKDKSQ